MMSVAVRVEGKVQGVWFRQSTCQRALELGVSGFVRNEAEGAVYVEISGEEKAVQGLIDFLHIGPPRAEVSKVTISALVTHHDGAFHIRR